MLPAADWDCVIRGGRVVDGTGASAVQADIAILAGRIAAMGPDLGPAKRSIDAQGRVVAPGFIDVHTHSESIGEIPSAENFLRMGVTTIVTGNCGTSVTDVKRFFGEVEATGVGVNVATLIGHNAVRRAAMGGAFCGLPQVRNWRK